MALTKYIMKRLLILLCTLFIVITITFFLMQIMPGTPFHNPKLTPEQLAALERAYGLDLPLWRQYLLYLRNMVTGNFGTSFTYMNQSVGMMVAQRLPVSVQLGIQAMLIGTFLGVLLGKTAATHKNTWIDTLSSLLSTVFVSVPSFIFGMILLLGLGFYMNVLPISGWGDFSSSIMPTIALAVQPMAVVQRFVRSEMVESLDSDYILLARAKGLSDKEVVSKHALRNSLIPTLTLIGPMTAGLLTGSMLIENMFNIPGIGQQFVTSIAAKDFPVIMGTTIVYAIMLMAMILMTDIATAFVDPRVRLQ